MYLHCCHKWGYSLYVYGGRGVLGHSLAFNVNSWHILGVANSFLIQAQRHGNAHAMNSLYETQVEARCQ